MATSDVLQFNCSIENEIAQKATKDFAGMLGKAFEDYKNLWNEYLKLRKYCEDADIKIPFQLLKSESDNKDVSILPQTYVYHEEVSNECDSNSVQKQVEGHKLLLSPVLVKKRSKPKKAIALRNHFSSKNSKENSSYILMKKNIFISPNDSYQGKDKIPVESKIDKYLLNDNHKDVKECEPIAKVHKKMGISQLYNVDATLLPSGKILKQSKIVFLPNEQTTCNTAYSKHEELNLLRPHTSPTFEKNIKKESKNLCQTKSVDEEIIEGSPTKYTKSNLKIKSLKLKKKNPTKLSEKNDIRKNITFGRLNVDKPSGTKLLSIKDNQVSFDQHLPSVCTSTQKDEPCLITKSKTAGFSHNETIGSDSTITNCLLSPVTADIEHLYAKGHLSTPVKKTKQLEIIKNDNLTKKRKFPDTVTQIDNYNSSMYDEETFCLLGENLKKQSTSDVRELEMAKVEMPKSNSLLDSPPAKKCLMNSFDIPSEKKDIDINKPSKSKLERAKMTGVTCWECKTYYTNLGLSEKEIQARKNECSRHRTMYNERISSPEGFWNPLFSQTFASTIQDDMPTKYVDM